MAWLRARGKEITEQMDEDNRRRGRELADLIAADPIDDEDDDPTEQELYQEFDAAVNNLKIASWDANTVYCCDPEHDGQIVKFTYSRKANGALLIDRGSKTVVF
jgi:hypothetical protein